MDERTHRGTLIAAATLLGAGLGGFFDGIVFHQILQWHNMLSSVVAPVDVESIKYNMVWDGVFHALTWLMVVIGLALLWRAGQSPEVPWSSRTFVGSLALGWGLFNVVEGVIDHHVLRLHHLHPGTNQMAWDVGFLAVGAGLIIAGWALIQSGRIDVSATPRARTPQLPTPHVPTVHGT